MIPSVDKLPDSLFGVDEALTMVTAREIDAPVRAVWAAWEDPTKVARWWGPAGFASTVRELDVREGGRLDLTMHGPDGTDFANLYVFDRVEPFTRIVFTNTGSEEFGLAAFRSTVDFEDLGDGRTRVTQTSRFASPEEKRKHVEDFHAEEGSRELLERLEAVARE
jgi:uncharacterized protein YndB with AHSA1/START domain